MHKSEKTVSKPKPTGAGALVRTARMGVFKQRSRIRYLSKKKFANFNEFSEIKKFVKIHTKIR